MTKILPLAASMMLLAAISGQAFAQTTAPHAQHWHQAVVRSDQMPMNAFDAFAPAMATQSAGPSAHRYQGGPKSND